jgi:hypothetical protein
VLWILNRVPRATSFNECEELFILAHRNELRPPAAPALGAWPERDSTGDATYEDPKVHLVQPEQ